MLETLKLIERLMAVFFRNGFEEAERLCRQEPDFDDNVYLKAAVTYKAFVYTIFTLEKPYIDDAYERLKVMQEQISKDRKGYKFSSWFFKQDMNEYTDEEAHVELLNAEANMLAAVMAFVSDPNILTVIKAAFRLRAAHSAYKFCGQILKEKTNWESAYLRVALDDGYKLGWGFYNILLSHMPDRVLKILAFVGYDCDRDLGLRMTHFVTEQKRTYRSKILAFIVCFYSFYIEQFFGCGTADKDWVKKLTSEGLAEYPTVCHNVHSIYFLIHRPLHVYYLSPSYLVLSHNFLLFYSGSI